LSYDLDFQATFEQGAGSEEYKRNMHVVAPKRKRKDDDLATTKKGHKKIKKKASEDESLSTGQDILTLVAKLLPKLSRERHSQLATEVFDCYTRVRSTQCYAQRQANSPYTLKMHTIIVVYSVSAATIRRMQ
jgi:hypothetical protein